MLASAEGVELAAVAARDVSKAESFAKKFGAKKVSGSYGDLIADSGVDAVYIVLTHNFHYEIARLCLESGTSTPRARSKATSSPSPTMSPAPASSIP